MEVLPGFNEYLFASYNQLPLSYNKYSEYIIEKNGYEIIIEDYLNNNIKSEDVKNILFAYKYSNYDESDYDDLIKALELLDDISLKELKIDKESISNDYDRWVLSFLDEILLTQKRALALQNDIDTIEEEMEEFNISEPTIDTSHFESIIDVKEKIENLTSLFDLFEVSEHFPVLWYPDRKFLKVYNSYKGNLNFTIDSMKKDTLYALYSNNKTAEIFSDERNFKLTTKLTGQMSREELILLFRNFPFKLDEMNENNVILTYQLRFKYPVFIHVNSFLYTFSLHGLFSRYFHIMETNNLPSSNHIRLRYIFPFDDIDTTIIPFQLRGNQIFEGSYSSKSRLMSSSRLNQNSDEGFIEIRIQAESDEAVRDYIKVIGCFISKYLKQQELVNKIVSEYINEEDILTNSKTRSNVSRRTSSLSRPVSIVENLSSEPILNYFTTGSKAPIDNIRAQLNLPPTYSRECGKIKQPHIIKKNLVEDFEKEKFSVDGKIHHRLALPFPIEDPKVYLGCPSDEYPFIGVRNAQDNVIPCCYSEDQNVEGKQLYNYLKGIETNVNRIYNTANLKSLNVLSAGASGEVPEILADLFATFRPGLNFLRYGSVGGTQTILHAILMAVDDDYKKEVNKIGAGRNNLLNLLVTKKRKEMAEDITEEELNVLTEAAPDLSSDMIRKILKDEERYLDPRIFIPLFEVYFGIRLLVFEMDEEKNVNLVQPNYMIYRGSYPVSYVDNIAANNTEPAPMVAIFGQKNIRIQYHQWELIVTRKKDMRGDDRSSVNVLFDADFAKNLVEFFLDKIPTYQLDINRDKREVYLADRLWFNPYVLVRLFQRRIKNFRIRGQSIDSLGKVRVLYFSHFSLMIPPISPLAVRKIDDEPYNKNKYSILSTLTKLLGNVSYLYQDQYEKYWKVEWVLNPGNPIELKIAFLFESVDKFDYPYDKLIFEEIENYNTISIWKETAYYRKTSKRLQKLICFLFLKYLQYNKNEKIIDIEYYMNLWRKEFIIQEEVIYDFSSLYGIYPIGNYINCLSELNITGLINDQNQIVFKSENIEYNLMSYLKIWMMNREKMSIDSVLQEQIENFYENVGDFIQRENMRIFVGKNAVRAYLAEMRNIKPPEVIRGPFRQISLLHPVERWEYAAARSTLWQTEKINAYQIQERVPQMGKMNKEEIKQTFGTTNMNNLLYYVEEQAPGRGVARFIYKAVIPLADNVS